MLHPRIEEVEDSDVDMSDPSEGDIDHFVESDILRSRKPQPSSSSSFSKQPPTRPAQRPAASNPHVMSPSQIPSLSSGPSGPGNGPIQTTTDPKAYAGFQCLYPIYFDSSRTRAQGRRIPKDLAVSNPLAREIFNACRDLRLQTLFEPEKMHPKDWANPGRVKVQLKPVVRDGRTLQPAAGAAGISNKHQLYVIVAQHLRNNPTTQGSAALWERLPGMPAPDPATPYPRPAVPRGWKMGDLLPYYSPAMTGGGVCENVFKDMMKEIQGGGDMASVLAGAGAAASGNASGNASEDGAGKRKKEKKGKSKVS